MMAISQLEMRALELHYPMIQFLIIRVTAYRLIHLYGETWSSLSRKSKILTSLFHSFKIEFIIRAVFYS